LRIDVEIEIEIRDTIELTKNESSCGILNRLQWTWEKMESIACRLQLKVKLLDSDSTPDKGSETV